MPHRSVSQSEFHLSKQIIHSDYIGLRNIAIAHLLATQLSLWILSLSTDVYHHEKLCNYTFDVRRFKLITNSTNNSTTRNGSLVLPDEPSLVSSTSWDSFAVFKSVLHLLTHQFKLLTIFILITMWFTNNQSKINFIRAKLSDEEVIRASNLNPDKKRFLLKGFAVGLLFLVLAIVTVLFPDNEVLRSCSMIVLQVFERTTLYPLLHYG